MHEPLFQRIHLTGDKSFNVLTVDRPHFVVPWHLHPEVEIMLVLKGKGTRFIGDSIEHFEPLDLVMVGANLAHVDPDIARIVNHTNVPLPVQRGLQTVRPRHGSCTAECRD